MNPKSPKHQELPYQGLRGWTLYERLGPAIQLSDISMVSAHQADVHNVVCILAPRPAATQRS